jgi:type II restriction enzyme
MSNSLQLSNQRVGTIINKISKKQEAQLGQSVNTVRTFANSTFGLSFVHKTQWHLKTITNRLIQLYPTITFAKPGDTSFIKPDGGVLFLEGKDDILYPVLITEVKHQGTNNDIIANGGKKQAKGNAIERLGKNVIGIRAILVNEDIFPFVCFGDGCDFAAGSNILDRVVTINDYGPLNNIKVYKEAPFVRGSFFFREKDWTEQEIYPILETVVEQSVTYYINKYGKSFFKPSIN